MALVNCLDCGTEVSDQAAVCPKCSRPNPGAESYEVETKSSKSGEWGFYFLGYIVAFIIFAVKNGAIKGVFIGIFVALLSWIYVAYALIQKVFG